MSQQPGTPESKEQYTPVTQEAESPSEVDEAPNPQTGVGIGMGEESSFEPEEDPEAAAGE